jgi:hypothetical protein
MERYPMQPAARKMSLRKTALSDMTAAKIEKIAPDCVVDLSNPQYICH